MSKKNGMDKHDWRDAINVLKDDQLRAALIRQRDGTPEIKGEGKCGQCGNENPLIIRPYQPRVIGLAEQLADLIVRRTHPRFGEADGPDKVAEYDAQLAMIADMLADINDRLDNANKLRKAYMREEPEPA